MLDPNPRERECGLSVVFRNFPDDFNMQLGLRTTELESMKIFVKYEIT